MAPLPGLNTLVEYVMRHLFFRRAGFPACALAPVVADISDDDTFLRGYEAEHALLGDRVGTADGVDSTCYFMGVIGLYARAAERLYAAVEEDERAYSNTRRLLEASPSLNRRQADLVATLARGGDETWTFKRYQDAFGVAYATAHSDLLGLVDLGLVSMRKRGKALVFEPVTEAVAAVAGSQGKRASR